MSALPFAEELRRAILPCNTLLDVGCGSDSPIQSFANELQATGVDGFSPSLEKSRAKGIHRDYRQMNLLEIDQHFQPQSFDVVLASDVIEHFDKPEGLAMLAKMEHLARRRVVVFTPNGFLPQEPFDGNEYQLHRSGWTVKEMRDLGYEVIGIRGWRPLRGDRALPRFRPQRLWAKISDFTQPWTRSHPDWAFQLLCVKHLTSNA